MSASVSLRGCSVSYGDRVALSEVTLDVRPGEVLAVLGPSGCGKSTLLRTIAGLQRPDAGVVEVGGRDLAGVPAHRRGVGMMFQAHALFPHRDVAGNVAFGLRQQGRRGADVTAAVTRLLALVGLPGAERRAVHELSGGEQQRVALARALAPSPSVLLLDEPLGALDRELRERLVRDLRVLFDELGLTVLAVTHDQAEAFALADRVVVMQAGQVRQVGTPAEVWGHPVDASVAAMLGLTNVVDAVVSAGVARTPWGAVAVTGADGPVRLLVRPEGVRLGHGELARVVAVGFQGARTTLELALPGAPSLRAAVPSSGAPSRNDEVRVEIDADQVVRLEG